MKKSAYKNRKRRAVKRTVLLFCEGKNDEAFCKYIVTIFNNSFKTAVKVKGGRGGSPTDIVNGAIRVLGGYDTRVVFLDSDKTDEEMGRARKLAKQNNIVLIENSPCLEMILLQILGSDLTKVKRDSHSLKKYFESNYISANKRSEIGKYNDLFPKELIESKSMSLESLGRLILLITDK